MSEIKNKKYVHYFLILISSAFFMGSCGTSKYLSENEVLLKKNNLKFETSEKIENKSRLKLELYTFYEQVPNSNFLWIPREWIYFKNSDPGDSSWFNKWARNRIGEPPSIFNESLSRSTATSMQQYLRNKKGYYNADVNYQLNKKGDKGVAVDYVIRPKKRYRVSSISYIGKDQKVVDILKDVSKESLVKVGDPIDAIQFDLEKTRMVTELQNRGYANFVPNYLDIKGDSLNKDHAIDIFWEVFSPLPDTSHKIYTLGKINVYTDYYNGQNRDNTVKDTLGGINYYREMDNFLVRPGVLSNSLFLEKDQILKRDDRNKTYRKLSNLGAYRFISMHPRVSTENDSIIDYDIFLTPHQKKWSTDIGSDFYYSTISQAGRRLFGFSVNGLLENRNFFGGSENFTISAETGFELEFNPFRTRTLTLGLNNNLEIPKQVDLLGLAGFLKWSGILTNKTYTTFKEETKTNIELGFSRIDIRDFYNIYSFNTSFGFDYQPDTRNRFIIRQTGFDLNLYTLEPGFLSIIGNNPLIINSFQDNILTGYLFRDITYVYNSRKTSGGRTIGFVGNLETSGWETYLANRLYNSLSDSDDVWTFNNINFSKFVKLELETIYNKELSSSANLAARLNFGIARPFGGDNVIPFTKQFSVGGPNSLRAWDQKELGPGGYSELLLDPIDGQPFYQQGDLKLEFNLEYRFDLFWIMEGALFTDIGNVWTLEDDPRLGSKFTSDFYKQLAVAGGWGIRFDFIYFNIRFDFGYKLRNPYPNPDTSKYWTKIGNLWSEQRLGNLQIAVNYPF